MFAWRLNDEVDEREVRMKLYHVQSGEMVNRGKAIMTKFTDQHSDTGRKKAGATISRKKWLKALTQRMKEAGL